MPNTDPDPAGQNECVRFRVRIRSTVDGVRSLVSVGVDVGVGVGVCVGVSIYVTFLSGLFCVILFNHCHGFLKSYISVTFAGKLCLDFRIKG
jgi:hypothetical protein